ncbi:MAG: Sec-independent protein translocase protein TatB [bacterium]|nr:twin-arginine translocase subunit TatB [Gammaproteobacteria bacterium]HIL94575.1 twin-arginine translocase subunit TatB [Pseudomonadales bacterium]
MFDVGFPEILLVSVVALLFIGPERLPETVRTIMLWLGRIRTSFANIKTEIEQEIGADEIRRQIYNESIMTELDKSKQQIQDAIQTTDNTISELKNTISNPLQSSHTEDEPLQDISAKPEKAEPDSDEAKRSESGG